MKSTHFSLKIYFLCGYIIIYWIHSVQLLILFRQVGFTGNRMIAPALVKQTCLKKREEPWMIWVKPI